MKDADNLDGSSPASDIAGETLEQVGETTPKPARAEPSTGRSAFFVGAGILISRIVGLIRQRIFAHYFGSSAEGDAFSAAFRIPNFLQNVRSQLPLFRSMQNFWPRAMRKRRRE
jgi:putative peptidoglycan lipid II flippase